MRKHTLVFTLALSLAATLHAQPAATLPFTVAKETTVIITPLKDDGSPDYVAALNQLASKGVTPQNNAYAGLLQIFGTESNQISPKTHDQYLRMVGIPPTPAQADVWVDFITFAAHQQPAWDDYFALHRRLWKADEPGPNVQMAVDYFQVVNPLLDRAATAIALPKWWSPAIAPHGLLLEVLLPSLGSMRDLANAFAVRATLRAGSGDFAGFLVDVKAMKQLAAHLGNQSTLIERLVSVAIDALADETIGTVAASGTLTEDQCKRLRAALAAVPALPPASAALNMFERWAQLEIAQCIARGRVAELLPDIGGNNDDLKINQIEIAAADWNAALVLINQQIDKTVAALNIDSLKKSHEQTHQLEEEILQWKADPASPRRAPDESAKAYGQRAAKMIMAVFFPSLGRAEELRRRAAMQDAMVDALIMAAQLKAKNGTWPEKLTDLAAAGLTPPADIYNQPGDGPPLPVHYLVTAKGVRIYSIGENGIDDGGLRDPAKKMDDIGIGATLDAK